MSSYFVRKGGAVCHKGKPQKKGDVPCEVLEVVSVMNGSVKEQHGGIQVIVGGSKYTAINLTGLRRVPR